MAPGRSRHNVIFINLSKDLAMSTTPVSLGHVRVHEAMHHGIIGLPPDTPLRAVAKVMAERHVHAIAVVDGSNGDRPIGIVSALDVVGAAANSSEETAGDVAATEVLTVSSRERLDHAAQLMAEHELSHLIVTDSASGHPTGVLSTLDVAAVFGA
jgi:CBS domain-containing protein